MFLREMLGGTNVKLHCVRQQINDDDLNAGMSQKL
jgi:hypothetical protein